MLRAEVLFLILIHIKKISYFSEEVPLSPVQLSSQHFRESLVAEWQQFTAAHQNANISSNLKFGNAYDGFKQSIEFDNLITLLKDVRLPHRSICRYFNSISRQLLAD